jgi:uncharacterized protein YndB with AHSA1/START domain
VFKIAHDFSVRAPRETVYAAVSTARGLDAWWTQSCSGEPKPGAMYQLGFGGSYAWGAEVVELVAGSRFALKITDAAPDWLDTVVRFELKDENGGTAVQFEHIGWAIQSPHYRRSSFCWAAYLRLLRIYCETGASCPYEQRYFA